MACVRYRFKSSKDFETLPIFGNFISVADLKRQIAVSARFGKGKDFDLRFTNAQTGEEYTNETAMIPKQSSVLVQRIPGPPRERIVIPLEEKSKEPHAVSDIIEGCTQQDRPKDSFRTKGNGNRTDLHDLGNHLFREAPRMDNSPSDSAANMVADDEDSKIRALVSITALDYGDCTQANFGRKFDNGRIGHGRNLILEDKTPPEGYVCHRCGIPGHFIYHCSTNGDPNYNNKRMQSRTCTLKAMPLHTSVANDEAFEKEMEGLPSTQRPTAELPPELLCPLCKAIMKDAVLTSKCCFSSFCDKCIRDHVIAKLSCVCGASGVMADDLIPNKTLRETIRRYSESATNNSSGNWGNSLQNLDVESGCPVSKTSTASTITQNSASLFSAAADESKTEVVKVNNSEPNATHSPEKDVGCVENEISKPSSRGTHIPQESKSVIDEEAHSNIRTTQQSGQLPRVKKSSKKKVAQARSEMESYNTHYNGGYWIPEGSFQFYPGTVPYVCMPNAYGFAQPGVSSTAMGTYWMQSGYFGNQMLANNCGPQMQGNAVQDLPRRPPLDGSRTKDEMNSGNLKSKNNVCFSSVTPLYENSCPFRDLVEHYNFISGAHKGVLCSVHFSRIISVKQDCSSLYSIYPAGSRVSLFLHRNYLVYSI